MGTMAQVILKGAACSGARTTKLPENSLTAAVSRIEEGRRTRWRTLDVGRARFTCVHTRHLSWIRITSRMCGRGVHSLQYVEEYQQQLLWARKDLSVHASACVAGLFGGRKMCTCAGTRTRQRKSKGRILPRYGKCWTVRKRAWEHVLHMSHHMQHVYAPRRGLPSAHPAE